MADIKFSDLATVSYLTDTDIACVSQPDGLGGHVSMGVEVGQIKTHIRGKELSATLTAGSTTLTFNDNDITTGSTLDFYVSEFGVQPVDAVVTTHQLVLTFLAQASDISVKVRVS